MAKSEKPKKATSKLPVQDNTPEGKVSRFKKIAARRTQKIIVTLKNLGNCSNTSVYGYTPEQTKAIFIAIQEAVDNCKEKFAEKEAKKSAPEFKMPD